VLVNPEIVRASPEIEEGVEGCLSIPGWQGLVDRHYAITIQGLERNGKSVRIKARGLLARAFQHEVDHLEGVLFIDRITDPEKIWRTPPPGEEGAEGEGDSQPAEKADEPAMIA
jgi:peptide deformylase